MRTRPKLLFLALLGLAPACNTVEFYEKGALSSPVMQLGDNRTLSIFEQKA